MRRRKHTGSLIQYLNQESGSERRAAPVRVSRGRSAGAYRVAFLTGSTFRAGYSGRRGCREFRRSRRRICRAFAGPRRYSAVLHRRNVCGVNWRVKKRRRVESRAVLCECGFCRNAQTGLAYTNLRLIIFTNLDNMRFFCLTFFMPWCILYTRLARANLLKSHAVSTT